MAVYDEKSRYRNLPPYTVQDRRGRTVKVLPPAADPREGLLGIHALREGERLDHLAAKYLRDNAGFWRIAEKNGAMHPEQLSEQREIEIPQRKR
jgi:hypothetical protein